MARVFLSHARADKPAVRRVATALRSAGHNTWLDEDDILVGDSIPAAVERGLRDSDFVVICLSKAAAERGWLEAERDATLMQEFRERKERILPVRLEEVAPPYLIAPIAYVDLFPDEHAFAAGIDRLTRSIQAHQARRNASADGAPSTRTPAGTNRVSPPIPSYANAEVRALSEQLERARVRRQNLRDSGIATEEVDREVLQLRRQLREGGQLRAGDALGDGRYLLVEPLGRGGFAVVWDAFDRAEQRRVAIKVLHLHLAGDPQRRERFFRGARVMMDLKHPAVVRVYDPRCEDEIFCYFVMELVAGGTLRDAVLRQRIDAARRLPLILQVGDALAVAHRKGLIHRDIKPANILLDQDGNAKLTDFDLVGALDSTGGTRTGALGTVVYAAPECLDKPQDATTRADVFGLGMTTIFCLHGRDLSMGTFRDPLATVAKLDCPASVRKVLERAVAWEPDHRFLDAADMMDALGAELGQRPRWAVASDRDQYGLWAAFEVLGVRHRMRWIPPGTFMMGSPKTELGRYTNEGPLHQVTLTRGYWLGETPVTWSLWCALMPDSARHRRDDDMPVTLSWDDCQKFLDRLNAHISGLAARLPTEAEWERACRAGTRQATWIGDLSGPDDAPELNAIAWYGTSLGNTKTPVRCAVGRKAPNPYGLHDMLGNVWEWCRDGEPCEYPSEPVVNPVSPGQGPLRVRRGGASSSFARNVRAACRDSILRDKWSETTGFRLAGDQELALR